MPKGPLYRVHAAHGPSESRVSTTDESFMECLACGWTTARSVFVMLYRFDRSNWIYTAENSRGADLLVEILSELLSTKSIVQHWVNPDGTRGDKRSSLNHTQIKEVRNG